MQQQQKNHHQIHLLKKKKITAYGVAGRKTILHVQTKMLLAKREFAYKNATTNTNRFMLLDSISGGCYLFLLMLNI